MTVQDNNATQHDDECGNTQMNNDDGVDGHEMSADRQGNDGDKGVDAIDVNSLMTLAACRAVWLQLENVFIYRS